MWSTVPLEAVEKWKREVFCKKRKVPCLRNQKQYFRLERKGNYFNNIDNFITLKYEEKCPSLTTAAIDLPLKCPPDLVRLSPSNLEQFNIYYLTDTSQ